MCQIIDYQRHPHTVCLKNLQILYQIIVQVRYKALPGGNKILIWFKDAMFSLDKTYVKNLLQTVYIWIIKCIFWQTVHFKLQ